MDTRPFAPLAAIVLLASLPACARTEGASVPLRAGSAAPAEWSATAGEDTRPTYLVWIARTEDCLSCQDIDFEFRRVQARWRGEVPLLVLHVGSARNETVPRAFLKNRRVDASYETVSPRVFARRYGEAVVPAIYLVNDGLIVWSSTDLRVRPTARLDSLVSQYRP